MASQHELGREGENFACEYLKENGYKVLERNWRYGNDEIDIIALIENTLVIVEVKTRRSDNYGAPQVFVNNLKQKFMIRAASAYLQKTPHDYEVRFDVIALIKSKDGFELEHIDDAFRPRW